MLANKKLIITVIESLPKDKTAVLGTCEVTIPYSCLDFWPIPRFFKETS